MVAGWYTINLHEAWRRLETIPYKWNTKLPKGSMVDLL